MHVDLEVTDLDEAQERAVAAGARLVDTPPRRFRVFLDPLGHPFCLVLARPAR